MSSKKKRKNENTRIPCAELRIRSVKISLLWEFYYLGRIVIQDKMCNTGNRIYIGIGGDVFQKRNKSNDEKISLETRKCASNCYVMFSILHSSKQWKISSRLIYVVLQTNMDNTRESGCVKRKSFK